MTGMTRRRAMTLMAAASLVMPAAVASAAGTVKAFSLNDAPLPMPEVTFVYEDGRPGALADFRGKHVLLNVWATWCPPCREEMPTLDRLQGLLGGDDFHVLPLSIDRAGVKVVQDFYAKTGIENLKIYVDQNAQVMRALKLGDNLSSQPKRAATGSIGRPRGMGCAGTDNPVPGPDYGGKKTKEIER